MQKLKQILKMTALALIVGTGCHIVNVLESQDEQSLTLQYCENVSSGVWPDYEKNFSSKCKNFIDSEK